MIKLIMGAILISFSAVWVRLVSVEPTVSAFYRMLFGGLALLFFVRRTGRSNRVLTRFCLLLVLASAFLSFDLMLWHRSILYIGPGLATLLANFQVFLLGLAGVLIFHEPLRRQLVLAIVLSISGLTLLVGQDWTSLGQGYHLGVIMGLLSALCYAVYLLSLRAARTLPDTPSSLLAIAVISMVCALILAVSALLEGDSFALSGGREAFCLVSYGILSQALGWVLISQGMPHVRTSQVGLILLLQPTLAFVWDVLFFHRPVSPLEGAGAVLALAGVYLGSLQRG